MTLGGTNSHVASAVPWGTLPARMKLLYLTTPGHAQGWLAQAFQADSAAEIALEEVVGPASAMARLREQVYDALLVRHEPELLDALDFVECLRSGGWEEPVLVLGTASERELAALCFEVGADGYCCVDRTTTRSLIWTIARARQHHQLLRENRQLLQSQRQRLAQEHQEAEKLLGQQRALVQEMETLRRRHDADALQAAGYEPLHADARDTYRPPTQLPMPESVVGRYREMLRAYVIMGSGNLTQEMTHLAELLVTSGVTAQRTMQLHVEVLEELIAGLGNRSARHVMNRADLLILEVLMHLCEGYRQRPRERKSSPSAAGPLPSPAPFAPREAELKRHRGYA